MRTFFFVMAMSYWFNSNAQVVETVITNPSVTDGMCTDSLGNVYTTSGGLSGSVIGKFSPATGVFSPNYINGLVGPTDVEFLNDSVLCITNYDIDAISTYNFNTNNLITIATGLDGPGGIEADENGFIYVTNWGGAPSYAGHTITKISPSGNSWTYIDTSALYRPQAITFNHENQLIVHSNSKLYKINEADSSLVFWTALSSGVGNIVFNNSDSCIYGAAPGAGQILKISPNGTVTTFAGSTPGYIDGDILDAKFPSPLGLTFSPEEDILYISEGGSYHILRRILLESFTKMEGIKFQNGTGVYPNPISLGEELHVQNENNLQIDQIVISNLEGKVLYVQFSKDNSNEVVPASVFEEISSEMIVLKIIYMDKSFEYYKVLVKE